MSRPLLHLSRAALHCDCALAGSSKRLLSTARFGLIARAAPSLPHAGVTCTASPPPVQQRHLGSWLGLRRHDHGPWHDQWRSPGALSHDAQASTSRKPHRPATSYASESQSQSQQQPQGHCTNCNCFARLQHQPLEPPERGPLSSTWYPAAHSSNSSSHAHSSSSSSSSSSHAQSTAHSNAHENRGWTSYSNFNWEPSQGADWSWGFGPRGQAQSDTSSPFSWLWGWFTSRTGTSAVGSVTGTGIGTGDKLGITKRCGILCTPGIGRHIRREIPRDGPPPNKRGQQLRARRAQRRLRGAQQLSRDENGVLRGAGCSDWKPAHIFTDPVAIALDRVLEGRRPTERGADLRAARLKVPLGAGSLDHGERDVGSAKSQQVAGWQLEPATRPDSERWKGFS
ncbi:hypothetical protein AURDEDRAFT_185707 [Auricularia subglabra TFB-10046 SS5]|nr:hypothetical protein AURDEDRAFT_185707 [Auricularia subglabra TFB-10046 SS5]